MADAVIKYGKTNLPPDAGRCCQFEEYGSWQHQCRDRALTGPQYNTPVFIHIPANWYNVRICLTWCVMDGFAAERSMPVPYSLVQRDRG